MNSKSGYKLVYLSMLLMVVLTFSISMLNATEDTPSYALVDKYKDSAVEGDEFDPRILYLLLTRIAERNWIQAHSGLHNNKRGLDLGLSRGYSGSQQAKHMMGIAAAGLGGPGRKRRSHDDTYKAEATYQ